MNFLNKKGELTTQQIVMLILLIVSFAIILFFILRANFGETNDSQICHESVVLKGNNKLPGASTPLNCKRQYYCLSIKNSCDKAGSYKVVKVKSKDDVFEFLAKALADCWWMFGEGKIDYVGGGGLTETTYCSICSQIVFDSSVKEKLFSGEGLSQEEFYTYLDNHEVSEGVSYFKYLYGDISGSSGNIIEAIKNTPGVNIRYYDFDKPHYVLMGVNGKVSSLVKWAGLGLAVIGAGILTVSTGGAALPVAGVILGNSAFFGGVGLGLYGFFAEGQTGQTFIKPTFLEVNSDEYKSLGCEVILTRS